MTKRFLNILLLIFTTQLLYSQEWHKQEYRELNFPSSIYYTQYIEYEYNKAKSKSNNKSFVLDIAKVELSKKIISEVQGESNLSTIRKGAVYNSIFNSNSKISTSATFVDLQVLESINKKKSIHILIYIKKNDFKILTKSRYEDLLNSIIGEVNACNQMYSDKSFTEAKVQGDFIELEIKKLKRLKNLLSVFNIDYDPIRHNSIIETFQPLYAKIKKHISDEQNYRYNKEQGDLKALSNISVELFKIYCQKALNYEQESKYYDAVNFYDKARNLFSGRKVVNEKETTTDRIIICQDKLIDILISQGVEEFDDNPNTALTNFKKAKDLITSMNRNDRIKEINKLLKKAKKEIKKRKNKEEKTSRKGRVKTIRGKSPHRVLFSIGGGFQNEYTNPNDIFSNAIKVDVDKWHISTTLGYRLNLPTEMTTSKTGFEKTKGNVLALFYKQGNTETNFEDNNFQSNFREIEFGYIFKERIRVSLGKGNRSIHVDYIDQLPSNYNCATGSWYMHFGRLSVETSVTYLLDEKFALEKAKLNANFSLRFYLYQKIYKKIKEKI